MRTLHGRSYKVGDSDHDHSDLALKQGDVFKLEYTQKNKSFSPEYVLPVEASSPKWPEYSEPTCIFTSHVYKVYGCV